jgi:hypothetical protein
LSATTTLYIRLSGQRRHPSHQRSLFDHVECCAAERRYRFIPSGGTGFPHFASPKLLGDFNSNGVVDAADYVIWGRTIGSSTVWTGSATATWSSIPPTTLFGEAALETVLPIPPAVY